MERQIAVIASTEIKPLLDEVGIDRLEFDSDRLNKLLDVLTQDDANELLPTSIRLVPYPADDSYTAKTKLLWGNEITPHIDVELPLFHVVSITKKGAEVKHDAGDINRTLVHELQHVVDISSGRFDEANSLHKQKTDKEVRKLKLKSKVFQSLLASAGLVGGGYLEFAQNKGISGSVIALFGLVSANAMNRFDKKTIEKMRLNSYLTNPLEVRAYGLCDALERHHVNPAVVSLHRNSVQR